MPVQAFVGLIKGLKDEASKCDPLLILDAVDSLEYIWDYVSPSECESMRHEILDECSKFADSHSMDAINNVIDKIAGRKFIRNDVGKAVNELINEFKN